MSNEIKLELDKLTELDHVDLLRRPNGIFFFGIQYSNETKNVQESSPTYS